MTPGGFNLPEFPPKPPAFLERALKGTPLMREEARSPFKKDLGEELANILAQIARESKSYERRSSGNEWVGAKTLTVAVNDAIYAAMRELR